MRSFLFNHLDILLNHSSSFMVLIAASFLFILLSAIANVNGQGIVINPPLNVGNIPTGMAFDPINQRMYVANYGSDTVSIIDTKTNSVVNSISVGKNPISIAYDPVNQRMYVVNIGRENNPGSISVIDIKTNSVSNINLIHPPNNPISIAYDSVNQRMYVAIAGSINIPGSIAVINTNTNTIGNDNVLGTINVGIDPENIAYDPVNQRMYVSVFGQTKPNFVPGNVTVINTNTNTIGNDNVLGTINFDNLLGGIAYDPVHQRMYIANINNNTLSLINTKTTTIGNGNIIGNISIGKNAQEPYGLAYDPVHQRMYVTENGSSTVSVIDISNNDTVSNLIPVGLEPTHIAYDSVHQRMYVTGFGDPQVFVIDTGSNAQIICPASNLEHWDSISFKLTSNDLASIAKLPVNSELGIKVLDNSNGVVDFKKKILDFINLPDTPQTREGVQITGESYLITCAES